MKKSFFTLSLLLASFASASAQVEIGHYRSSIPADFTYDHTPYVYTKDDNEYKIYDFSLNEVAYFVLENVESIDTKEFVNENGYGLKEELDVMLTQTLFNDDPDWEYVEKITEEETVEDDYYGSYPQIVTKEYLFKKTDGTIIGRLDGSKYSIARSYVFGKNFYFDVRDKHEDGSYTDRLYTIPQFRRLIAGEDPSRINAKVMDQKAATFDLSGRKVGSDYHGVVVKGNVKKIQ